MAGIASVRDKIKESGIKITPLAAALGLTSSGAANKVLGNTEFKETEIVALCKLFGVSADELFGLKKGETK